VGKSLAETAKVQLRALTLLPLGNILIALTAILLATQVARLFWIIVTPVGPLDGWSRAISQFSITFGTAGAF